MQKYAKLADLVLHGEEYLNRKYMETFCVDGALFGWLFELCRPRLSHEDTNTRSSIAPAN